MFKLNNKLFTPYFVLALGVFASIFSSVILVRAQQSYITEYILVSYGGASINAYGSATGLHVIQGDNIFGESLTLGTSDITNSALKWPQNVYGGSGDQAGILYTRQGTSGENTILKIANYNDAGDGILIDAGYVTFHGSQVNLISDLQIFEDTMSHYEEHKGGSTTYYYAYGECNIGGEIIKNNKNDQLASANENNIVQDSYLNKLFNYFYVPEAQAKDMCYPTLAICIAQGCTGCEDGTPNCPTSYQCSVYTGDPCDDYISHTNAVCDTGDTPINIYSADCCGHSYRNRVYCEHTTATTESNFYTKLEFLGSGSGTAPNTRVPSTNFYDNLIVNNNEWGDGDDSSVINCETRNVSGATICSDGEFMAGYNNSANEITCCKL